MCVSYVSYWTFKFLVILRLHSFVTCFVFFVKLTNVPQPRVGMELLARRMKIATPVSHVPQDGRGKTAMKVFCGNSLFFGRPFIKFYIEHGKSYTSRTRARKENVVPMR